MLLAALVVASSLIYPIPELGSCDSLSSCKTYCDIPWHQTVCTDYGVDQGVLEKPQILAAVAVDYPVPELGNCGSKFACKAYCDDSANRPACVDFARAHGIDISTAASGGRAPSERPGGAPRPGSGSASDLTGLEFPIAELGNCASVRECKLYCDQSQNRQACFDFAYEKGLVGGTEAAGKLSGLKFPIAELGNCGSMAECDTYCSQPDHHEQCDAYAKKMGFEPPGGGMVGPGGCTSDEECDAYCSNSAHREECEAAWQKHCGPNPDRPECQKGPPGGGPGGCTSDEECRGYCEANPDDEDCKRGREEWCQDHPDDCKEYTGPGGCMSEDECRLYCQQNPDDAECQRGHDQWCQDNPEECRRSREDSNQCGGMDCGEFCRQNPDSDYCRQADDRWCRENPVECAAKDDQWGPDGGPVDGPGGGSNDCGGMDCGQFCDQNPDDEYCLRKNEEYCQQFPEECGPPGDYGETYYGPGGCTTPEECDAYCRLNPTDLDCYPQ